MSVSLDEILDKLNSLPEEEKTEILKAADEACAGMLWVPNPGPQTEAYFSPADLLYYGGSAGGGKALAIDTPIPTPDGWKLMGGLKRGDRVFDENGKTCTILAATEVMRGRPCYRVCFSDGAEIIADAEHQWVTQTDKERVAEGRQCPDAMARRRRTRPSRATGRGLRPHVATVNAQRAEKNRDLLVREKPQSVRTTIELLETITVRNGARLNHSITVADALEYAPNNDALMSPYLLGAWLGDGQSSSARICMAEAEMVKLVTTEAQSHGWSVTKGANKYDYGIVGGMKVALRELGVLGEKHIPESYKLSSISNRLSLLQGLMDTDGTVDARGHCEFSVVNRTLAYDALEIIRSLGIKAKMSVCDAKLRGRYISDRYRIKFMSERPVFRLARKRSRQKREDFRPTVGRKYIQAIHPVQSVPVKCIQVDSPSSCFLAGKELTTTHNSQLMLGLAVNEHRVSRLFRRHFKDIDGEGGLAPAMAEIVGQALNMDGPSNKGYNSQKHVWQIPQALTSGDKRAVEFGAFTNANEAESYQGRAADLFGFDEAVQFQEDLIRFIIAWNRPGAGVPPDQRCRTILASNPPVTAEGLWIFDWFGAWLDPEHPKPALPGELRWYAQVEGHEIEVDKDWVGEVKDAQGRALLIYPKSRTFIPASLSDNPDLMDAGYASQLASLSPHLQNALLEGKFTSTLEDADRQIIPTEWILQAQQRYALRKHDLHTKPMTAVGVDVADGGKDRMTVVPLHENTFGEPKLKPGVEVKTTEQKAAFILTVARDDPQINIDNGGGYGSGVSDMLESNSMNVKRIKGANAPTRRDKRTGKEYANFRAQMIYEFRDALDPEHGDDVALPPGREIVMELTAFREEPREDTRNVLRVEPNDKIKERIGRSPDLAWGFFFGWVKPDPIARGKRKSQVEGRRKRYGSISVDTGRSKVY